MQETIIEIENGPKGRRAAGAVVILLGVLFVVPSLYTYTVFLFRHQGAPSRLRALESRHAESENAAR